MIWQLIETAPKNGTKIIVCRRFEGRKLNDRRKPRYDMAVVAWDGNWWAIVSEYSCPFYDPTHWMHLPEPPIMEKNND